MAILGKTGVKAGNLLADTLKKRKKKKIAKRDLRQQDIALEARFQRFLIKEKEKTKGNNG